MIRSRKLSVVFMIMSYYFY